MKKILFLIAATFAIIGCNNKKKAEVFPVVVEKYTNEQASKAFKDLKWGMTVEEMIDLGYISVKDTSKWVIPLKYNKIGTVEFDDVSIMTHNNKLFAVIFHEYIEGFNSSVRKLNDVKILFNAKYGTPDFESEVCEDSLEFENEAILYSWNIKYKKIEGTIEKSQSDMFFVNVVIEDTITRHLHDSIAIAYQSQDI